MSDQEMFELHAKDFIECDTCRPKPGSPVLCRGCLHNRTLIHTLQAQVKEQQDKNYFLGQELATAQQRIQELEQEVERLKNFVETLFEECKMCSGPGLVLQAIKDKEEK